MGKSNLRCNEQIRISPVRVIGAENEQLGVLETYEALRMAREADLDLVEIAPNERPPVCKLMDYGKFKYNQKKHKQKHHEQHLKEVRLRPKTDPHDRDIKINRALTFLLKNDKVQFTMRFRGREKAHREIGFRTFDEITALLGDLVKVERAPRFEGPAMSMVVAPQKHAFEKLAKEGVEPKVETLRQRLEAAQAASAVRPPASPTLSSAPVPPPEPRSAPGA